MFQNAARPRGRPRSFDESDALKKATQVFWSKGYDGVTIDDLVAGMGVGRPSLYAVFGDKRAIFLRVLRAYAERKPDLGEARYCTSFTPGGTQLPSRISGFGQYRRMFIVNGPDAGAGSQFASLSWPGDSRWM